MFRYGAFGFSNDICLDLLAMTKDLLPDPKPDESMKKKKGWFQCILISPYVKNIPLLTGPRSLEIGGLLKSVLKFIIFSKNGGRGENISEVSKWLRILSSAAFQKTLGT